LHDFVELTLWRKIFDGEALTDLFDSELSWKERSRNEQYLMNDLIPILKQRANGQEISGLAAYEE
jgi:type I restriction enzyme, R subunit